MPALARDLPKDIVTRGRRVSCRCCGRLITVRGGQVWESRVYDASILIISAERDGAIVEQAGRDGERWGIGFQDLLRGYIHKTA